uniref:Uncharacterized protein n=1 Tax=Fundulus heteroclitus TaxID=8078 RepID=A0A3Q2P2S4_FUNHE
MHARDEGLWQTTVHCCYILLQEERMLQLPPLPLGTPISPQNWASDAVLKPRPHSWATHLKGLCPVCITLCLARVDEATIFPQKGHCRRLWWRYRLDLWAKVLPHSEHRQGLSPLWTFSCDMRYEKDLNLKLHCAHWKGRRPVCCHSWLIRALSFGDTFGQWLHLKGLPTRCAFS